MKFTTFYRRLFSLWHHETVKGIKRLLHRSGGVLLGITVGVFLTTEGIRFCHLMRPEVPAPFFMVLEALFELLISFFVFVLVPANVPENATAQDLGSLIKKHGSDLFFETLRVITQIIFRGLLLIVPGLIKYLRLAFVPFIVIDDAAYQRGDRDALLHSENLLKGLTWPWAFLNLVMLLVQIGISQLQSYLGTEFSLTSVSWHLFISLLNLGFYLYTTVLAFVIYRERARSVLSPENGYSGA